MVCGAVLATVDCGQQWPQLWHLDGERMVLGKPPQNGRLHTITPLALGPLGRCRAVGAGNTGGMGMGPPPGWGCLLGTWLLHELVADLVGGCSICPEGRATWLEEREECLTQPLPLLFGAKQCVGEEP